MSSEAAGTKPRSVRARSSIEPKKPTLASIKTAKVLSEAQRALGLFLFAHLNLTDDADKELDALGFHRTHHRILYLVTAHPGTNVGDLVTTLRLTPQAVQAPMKRLHDKGYIEQRHSIADRRKRLLYVTPKGVALVARLSNRQHKRLAEAFGRAGPVAAKGFMAVMENLLTDEDRQLVEDSSQLS